MFIVSVESSPAGARQLVLRTIEFVGTILRTIKEHLERSAIVDGLRLGTKVFLIRDKHSNEWWT